MREGRTRAQSIPALHGAGCTPARLGYGSRMREPSRLPALVRAAALAALAAYAAVAAGGAAKAGEVAVTCTNPISGASWQIRVDYEQRTVDSNPASVSDSEISWRDAKDGWRYTLERKSGKLTVTLASATGGNFLYDHCSPEN